MQSALLAKMEKIRLMIVDVDGILTDGSLYYGNDGEAVKRFNVLDGMGIKLLQQAGIDTAIISARDSAIVNTRARDLGIRHVQQGKHDKLSAFQQLMQETGYSAAQCGFIGDDIIDLPILTRVGLSVSVPSGHPEVLSRVDYITRAGGGQGAIREVADLILQAQHQYDAILTNFLK